VTNDDIEKLIQDTIRDPGSVCGPLRGESIPDWTAHAVFTALDAAGLLVTDTRRVQLQREWGDEYGRLRLEQGWAT
jgi:hypothetical protein